MRYFTTKFLASSPHSSWSVVGLCCVPHTVERGEVEWTLVTCRWEWRRREPQCSSSADH